MDCPGRVLRDDLVPEIEKLAAPAPGVVSRLDLSGGHLKSREQRGRSVPFIAMAEPVYRFSVRQPKVALRPLQRLNVRFLVDTDHHRFFRRIQIQANHIGCLGSKLRVGCDAPTPPPLQLDATPPQDAPYLVFADIA